MLRSGYVSYVHNEERYFRFDQASLAQMDTLCTYLTENVSWPLGPDEAALCKPGPEERGQAAQRLDAVGELGPEQRLLRILLEDDRLVFERALIEHLIRHRELMEADENATPASLLPAAVMMSAPKPEASVGHGPSRAARDRCNKHPLSSSPPGRSHGSGQDRRLRYK